VKENGVLRHRILISAGLAVTALAFSACARTVVTSSADTGAGIGSVVSGGVVGTTSAKSAVEGFMTAVKAQDLQTMSAIWGTANGAAREQMKREELEKRLIVIQCLLTHDTWRFAEDEARLSTGGRQQFVVEITRGTSKGRPKFTAILGPANRWFVEDVDVTALRDFCR